jgi:RimJ/RimL family protein N-acetyltransferase
MRSFGSWLHTNVCFIEYGRLKWRVLAWNEPAIGFYRRIGAEPLADWTVFRVTGDALQQLVSGNTP